MNRIPFAGGHKNLPFNKYSRKNPIVEAFMPTASKVIINTELNPSGGWLLLHSTEPLKAKWPLK